ncbi:MAG: hypothetical protein FWE98_02675 [Oscillospiraceae bacterium]|nr:hypothetical protein [Oscillospiraceae bacterium]
MKKALCALLALTLLFAMAVPVSAGPVDDMKAVLKELSETVGVEELKEAFEAALAGLGLDGLASSLPLPIVIILMLLLLPFTLVAVLVSLFT